MRLPSLAVTTFLGAAALTSALVSAAGNVEQESAGMAAYKLRRQENLDELRSRGIIVDGSEANRKRRERDGERGLLDLPKEDDFGVPPEGFETGRRLHDITEPFAPLSCNSPAEPDPSCSGTGEPLKFSDLVAGTAAGAEVVVPCGQCATVDDATIPVDATERVLDLPGGLDIRGKLTVPSTANVTLSTPHVFVQGELDIQSDAEITPANLAIRFLLTGTAAQTFVPVDSNAGFCGTAGCDVRHKAFIVAGGKLNIDAMPESCPTWTHLKSFTAGSVTLLDEHKVDMFEPPPAGCDVALIDNHFDLSMNGWSGDFGAQADIQADGTMSITDRSAFWQGPTRDITHLKKCLSDSTDYLFTSKVMLGLTNPDGVAADAPTACAATGTGCLKLQLWIRFENDYEHKETMNWEIPATAAPRYNEWTTFTSTIAFKPSWDIANAKYIVLKFLGPETGVDIIVDSAKLALPDPSSFVATCQDMIANANQEANGPHAFPLRMNQDRWPSLPQPEGNARVISKTENVLDADGNITTNEYGSVVGRTETWHGPAFREVPPICIQPSSVYRMSAKVRLHSRSETDNGDGKFKVMMELRAYFDRDSDGSYYQHYATRRLATSDPIDITDGWVTVRVQ